MLNLGSKKVFFFKRRINCKQILELGNSVGGRSDYQIKIYDKSLEILELKLKYQIFCLNCSLDLTNFELGVWFG